SQIFRGRHQLGVSGRHPEPAAPSCPPHRHSASRWRHGRCHRPAATPYASELEPARLRGGRSRSLTKRVETMRDLLNDLEAGRHLSDPDPVERARQAMKTPQPKRFYREAGVAEGEGGFEVRLDGRPARTP